MSAPQQHLYLRIAVHEDDMHKGKRLYHNLIEYLQSHGIAGATVRRSIEGYGASGILYTDRAIDATPSLTMVIETIDDADRLTPLLDEIRSIMVRGLISVEPIDVHLS